MTKTALVNPLQAFIRKSAASLPANTGTVAQYARRHGCIGPQIIVADVSGSMDAPAWGQHLKLDLLREAVNGVLERSLEPMRLITFHSNVQDGVNCIPDRAGGGTALHLGLQAAARHSPRATLVISDGQPDDEYAAIQAAEALPGRIDVLYIGPDVQRTAIEFMQRLARVGCGRYDQHDISRPGPSPLTHSINRLLIGPLK